VLWAVPVGSKRVSQSSRGNCPGRQLGPPGMRETTRTGEREVGNRNEFTLWVLLYGKPLVKKENRKSAQAALEGKGNVHQTGDDLTTSSRIEDFREVQ